MISNTRYLTFFLVGFLMTTRTEGASWGSIQNTLVVSVPGSESSALVVINDPARGPVWGIVENRLLFLLPIVLRVGGRSIESVDVSPDGRWLAIVAVSEGHSEFSLFDIRTIREVPRDGPFVAIPPVSTYNPYPDNVRFTGWNDETAILEVRGEYKLSEQFISPPGG